MSTSNPFFFEFPSDHWSFTDREAELPGMMELMKERGRRQLVYGRRRMGKTSLIKNAAHQAKITFVYCDISKAANMGEVARKLLHAAPREDGLRLVKVLDLATKYLKNVAITAGKIVINGELRPSDAETTLEGVLNLLNERAAMADQPWTVCLDEFQEIRVLGGDRIDWQLRAIMQEHRHLNYIFTGSDHRIIEWMTQPTAPFFKQLQQLEIGAIPRSHFAHWINKRAKSGGLPDFKFGDDIVDTAGPCTGDMIRLAKQVFSLACGKAPKDVVATAFDAIALVELNSEFLNQWKPMTPAQRSVLRAIANGKQPLAAATLRDYGIRAVSTASTAVEALIERQLLVRTPNGVIFDSPFFKRWVSFNGEK